MSTTYNILYLKK